MEKSEIEKRIMINVDHFMAVVKSSRDFSVVMNAPAVPWDKESVMALTLYVTPAQVDYVAVIEAVTKLVDTHVHGFDLAFIPTWLKREMMRYRSIST